MRAIAVAVALVVALAGAPELAAADFALPGSIVSREYTSISRGTTGFVRAHPAAVAALPAARDARVRE